MSFMRVNGFLALLASVVSAAAGSGYLADQQEPFTAAVSMVVASITAVALHAIACANRLTPNLAFQIVANVLASQMAMMAIIVLPIEDLVYDLLLISTIFSMFSVCVGFMCRDRVQNGHVNFV